MVLLTNPSHSSVCPLCVFFQHLKNNLKLLAESPKLFLGQEGLFGTESFQTQPCRFLVSNDDGPSPRFSGKSCEANVEAKRTSAAFPSKRQGPSCTTLSSCPNPKGSAAANPGWQSPPGKQTGMCCWSTRRSPGPKNVQGGEISPFSPQVYPELQPSSLRALRHADRGLVLFQPAANSLSRQ